MISIVTLCCGFTLLQIKGHVSVYVYSISRARGGCFLDMYFHKI